MRHTLYQIKSALFSSPANTVLTLLCLGLIMLILPPIVHWGIVDATWLGSSKLDCAVHTGACWPFVTQRITQFLFGLYPKEALWRIAVVIIAVLLVLLSFKYLKNLFVKILLLLLLPIVSYFLLLGGYFGLEVVETSAWGGLFLTLVLAITGIIASFPIGIVLALGRRSTMPVLRVLSITFIEIVRGVPLISVLFMASVMLPLFLPTGVDIDKLLRAIIGITLFQSAYLAEVIRGGLQAIPKGQYEAADSLGLSYWKSMSLIILPQALTIVIPGIVNTFIGLFKDTTLVLIIGLFDFLGIIQAATTDPEWLGMSLEGYVFCALIYWIFCYGMSKYSQRLESRLAVR